MTDYLLLTPGPLSTTKTVKEVMLHDWCTWDDDYNVNIVQEIRKDLVKLATSEDDEYTSVLLQGSGTYCVESVIISAIGGKDKLLILSNGAYGERIEVIAKCAGINFTKLSFPETEILNEQTLQSALEEDKDITHVAFVHCETTTGILNPIEKLCKIASSFDKRIIVDAMSSFGGIPMDVAALNIDFLVSSANKCIQGVPGFGFAIAKKEMMETCRGKSSSLSLDLYDQWYTMESQKGKWRFTSPTHVVRAFKQALWELDEEGGITARNRRYSENRDTLIEGMKNIGYTTLLDSDVQSPVITSFLYPGKEFDFRDFYNFLKGEGFVIYPGKISTADTFRVGTIGNVFPGNFKNLTEIIKGFDYNGR